jgi:phosphoglycerol transferase MdoB-like AlkP superfamily enzyme
MPDHGRNQSPNNIYDSNGFRAFDHTSDDNSRRVFALIAGPSNKVVQNQSLGSIGNPVGQTVDIVPTIAHILGFNNQIPSGMLQGSPLLQAFV